MKRREQMRKKLQMNASDRHEKKQSGLLLDAACLCFCKDDEPFRKVGNARGGGGDGEEEKIMVKGRPFLNDSK